MAVRKHRCPTCGFECDRDVNAAKNILKRAVQQITNVS
ncbi:zinc ribbon domain-containing protein [Paenibacillus azoreducens]